MAHDRLDIYLGELRPLLDAAASARGQKTAEYIRELAREQLLAESLLKDQVRQTVLDLAAAVEPDERTDPDDDDREIAATSVLARLLSSAYAAQGIAEALSMIWLDRQLPAPAGLTLSEVALAWLDELVDRHARPHTRETLIEKLIEEARRRG